MCFPTQSSWTYFPFYGNSKQRVKRILWDLATFPRKLLIGDLKGVNPWVWSTVRSHSLRQEFALFVPVSHPNGDGYRHWPGKDVSKVERLIFHKLLEGHLKLFFTLHQAVWSTFPANRQRAVCCHAVSHRRGTTLSLSVSKSLTDQWKHG